MIYFDTAFIQHSPYSFYIPTVLHLICVLFSNLTPRSWTEDLHHTSCIFSLVQIYSQPCSVTACDVFHTCARYTRNYDALL